MKKLRGHKPACKCVGCSAETRRRGMKALGLRKKTRKAAKAKPVLGTHKELSERLERKRRMGFPFYENARKAHRRAVRKAIRRNKTKKHKPALRRFMRTHRKRRHANPAGNLIGTSPVVHAAYTYRFPKARLITGQNSYQVRIIGIRSGTALPIGYGSTVRAIDYRNDAKAMRAYKRRAPFRHTFTKKARIVMSGWGTVGTNSGYIVIESSSHIWEKQS